MEQHLHNWLHTPSAYDVLFVRWVRHPQLPCAAPAAQHSTAQQTPQQAALTAHITTCALSTGSHNPLAVTASSIGVTVTASMALACTIQDPSCVIVQV